MRHVAWSELASLMVSLFRYGAALGLSLLALGVNLLLAPLVGENTFPPFFAAAILATRYGGLGPGLLAVVANSLLNDYFFLSPGRFLAVAGAGEAARFAVFLAFTLLVVALAASLRSARRRAEARAEQARRHAEALRASEARFRGMLELAPDGIVIANREGRIVFANSQAHRMFGYGPGELAGQAVEVLVPEALREIHARHRAAYHTSPRTRPMGIGLDLAGRMRDGTEFPIEISLSPMETDEGLLVTSVIRDISDRKKTEQQIRVLNADLQRRVADLAALNRELEAFSYSVSHDLRAPLRAMDGFSQALLEDYHDRLDAQGRDYLQRVRANAQRMAELIDDLLALARVTRAEMRRERVDLSAVARAVVGQLQRSEPERPVDVVIAGGLVAEGDPHLLRVALENLLGNAWKFTGREPRPRIELGVTEGDGGPAYFVRDNGVGFDMAHAGKLFGAFQRLHGIREFPGTGIGLATVQRIVHRHGGRVWAEAEVGKGATFYFTLEPEA